MAAALLGGGEAHAQSDTEHWSATLTRAQFAVTAAGISSDSDYGYSAAGTTSGGDAYAAIGTLAPSTFTYESISYTVQRLYVSTDSNSAIFQTSPALPNDAGLKLRLPTFRTSASGTCSVGGTEDFDLNASSADASFTGLYEWATSSTCVNEEDWASDLPTTGTVKLIGPAADSPGSNAIPVYATSTATRTVPENSAAGTDVGDPIHEATDAENDTLTYSMAGTDAASFAFDASTRQITTIANVDYNHEATQNSYSVTVTATDVGGSGGSATVTVTIDVTDVAEQPAKPDAPTVTATAGAADSLDVSWVKPDLQRRPGHYRL